MPDNFVFEFGSKKYFYFDGKVSETDEQGRYDLAVESMLSLAKALRISDTKKIDRNFAQKVMRQFLLDNEIKAGEKIAIEVDGYWCTRCLATWQDRPERTGGKPPERCPKCNSPYWNRLRSR